MRNFLKNARHLSSLVILLGVGAVAFIALRSLVIPADFGKYGHYRAGALDDIRARPISFAGRSACEVCHSDVVETKTAGKHAAVSCEACHGPQARHAEDPGEVKPPRPDAAVLCVRCHEANSAKPKWFPQVVSREHSGGESCKTCHEPHRPKVGG
ncbi:MAG: hypothetical protein HYS04_01335 [Acidobacteria bacterium]|nr:hypothetical protein [Acidobacteriota bacterium]